MANVFISFIHEEEGYAKSVQEFLGKAMHPLIDSFMASDRFKMYAGEVWLDRILEELKSATVLIMMASPRSVIRPWVNFEAGAAWMKDSKVVPVCFGGLEKDCLPKPYSSLHGINLQDVEDQKFLAHSVAHHLKIEQPAFPGPFDYMGLKALAGEEHAMKVKRGELALDLLQMDLERLKSPDLLEVATSYVDSESDNSSPDDEEK